MQFDFDQGRRVQVGSLIPGDIFEFESTRRRGVVLADGEEVENELHAANRVLARIMDGDQELRLLDTTFEVVFLGSGILVLDV
jgi:hypothetical protein